MITWILLVSLFCKATQDGHGQENGVLHCGAQNMTLSSSDQMILLTWEDDPSCSAVDDVLTYKLLVLIADKQTHHEEVAVMPDQVGSTHSWSWTSHLALKCASHSVRLSSRYKNQTSTWIQERTLPGIETSKRPEVFPRDRVFEVGSSVTFCCVVPAGQIFSKMYLTGYDDTNMDITKISNQTYALTVALHLPSKHSGTDVKCQTKTNDNGASIYIGYPPGDRDLQCETRDLESVDCHWTVGRKTHLSPTVYQLLGSQCADGSDGRCSLTLKVDLGERNWTLTAQNKLGRVELTDSADLTTRVHMAAPEGVMASTVNARNVRLKWWWTQQHYNNLNITCQIDVSHGEKRSISESFGVGLHSADVKDLIPNWPYNVSVKCGTTQHFWKWSDWSASVAFHTKTDIPAALDVWMQVRGDQLIAIWKMPLDNQSHGQITDYEVTWAKTTGGQQENRTTVPHMSHSLALSLDPTEEYIITVIARNMNGSSSPSIITIPSHKPDKTRVNTSWIVGSKGGFDLSWSTSPAARCGYIVDWCPTLGYCTVEWMKVFNKTSASIVSKNFSDGVRYTLSVYACTQGAPVLLEKREGYVTEKIIDNGLFGSLRWKQMDSNVEVSWDPINLREQSAFIRGIVLYCLDTNNNKIINVSTDDPNATSLTVRNLNVSSYTFTVKAQTGVGECGAASITATLDSLTDSLIKAIFISLAIVFGLLSLISILCCRHWTCIKRKVFPPIPKPVLDKWLTSEVGTSPPQCHQNEADIMDIPELHCNPQELVNGFVCQENMPFVFAPTPKGYYNQPLINCTPPSLTVSTAAIASQPVLPSSPFRGVFPNPSYNLIMQTGNQQSNSGPYLQEETPLERSSSGYQPQSDTEAVNVNQSEEHPESSMSCIFTYVFLPDSTPSSC
ncbi:leukemia inhibitory factor receptor-like [Pempheris klunzingeri]|uniref:leukemia inhibitory factor receptor-like n=1 Tax=Pempheris klunzingeri TaxID=3127111 RepID=UPI003980ED7A